MDKYNEALERARKLYKDAVTLQLEQDIKDYEYIFPELKKSDIEDERIRKALIEYLTTKDDNAYYVVCGVATKKILAWLEKQKQKPIVLDIDKMVDDYANSSERGNEEFGKPVNCMIRAYRQGLNDAIGKIVLKPGEWNAEDERLCSSCINHIEEELERIRNDKYGHSEIISDLKESCRERICWLESLKRRMGE